jgi:hypothetical protein
MLNSYSRISIEGVKMRTKVGRLVLSTAFLAAAFWTPRASLAWDICPSTTCSSLRNQCENSGGQFTQTYVTICQDANGTHPEFNAICEYTNQVPWDGVCYGV